MYFNRRLPVVVMIVGLAISVLAGCKSTQTLSTRPVATSIIVDGQPNDWTDALQRVPDEPFSLGLHNDGTHLYVAILANRPEAVRQMMGLGMTVWFDPEGGNKEKLGIRFPLGMRGGGMQGLRPGQEDPSVEAVLEARFRESLTDLEILRNGEFEGLRVPVASREDIAVAAGIEAGSFFYELKIALDGDPNTDLALGVSPGQTIGLGVETPRPDREGFRAQNRQGQAGRGGVGGGAGGGFGGIGDASQRPQRPGNFQLPEQIEAWLKVALQ